MKPFTTLSVILYISILSFVDQKLYCQVNSTDRSEVLAIKVRNKDFDNTFLLSKHLKSMRMIPLETLPECMVGEIRQIEFIEDKIIILQKKGDKLVLVFDNNGKFLNSIGRKGKGPGEYTGVSNLSVRPNSERVYLTDLWQQKIHIYESSGEFVKSIYQEGMFAGPAFVLSPNRFVLSNPGKGNYSLVIRESTGKDLKTFFPYDSKKRGDILNPLTPYGKNYNFIKYAVDTVYEISENGIYPKINYDFGSHHMTLDEFQVNFPGMPKNKWLLFGNYWDGPNLISTYLLRQKPGEEHYSAITFLYWKDSKIKEVIQANKSDDIFLNRYLSFRYVEMTNEWLTIYEALNLLEKRAEIINNKPFPLEKEITDMVLRVDENDNPILVLFKLRPGFIIAAHAAVGFH